MRKETIDALNEAHALLALDRSPKYDPLMTVDLDSKSLKTPKDSPALVALKEVGSPSVRSLSQLSVLTVNSKDLAKAELILAEEEKIKKLPASNDAKVQNINCCICTIL